MKWLIDTIGWIGSVLIVGSYYLNMTGKLKSTHRLYIGANLIGGLFFVVNTWYHGAYPSVLVNVVWVIIAIVTILKNRRRNAPVRP